MDWHGDQLMMRIMMGTGLTMDMNGLMQQNRIMKAGLKRLDFTRRQSSFFLIMGHSMLRVITIWALQLRQCI